MPHTFCFAGQQVCTTDGTELRLVVEVTVFAPVNLVVHPVPASDAFPLLEVDRATRWVRVIGHVRAVVL